MVVVSATKERLEAKDLGDHRFLNVHYTYVDGKRQKARYGDNPPKELRVQLPLPFFWVAYQEVDSAHLGWFSLIPMLKCEIFSDFKKLDCMRLAELLYQLFVKLHKVDISVEILWEVQEKWRLEDK